MTPAERKLWSRLRANRLEGFHFRRQHMIEVDGSIHQEQEEYDRQREQRLRALGLQGIRFTSNEVLYNLEAVLEEILRMCRCASTQKENLEEKVPCRKSNLKSSKKLVCCPHLAKVGPKNST
jgi:very-short-patch-repair endonuclease